MMENKNINPKVEKMIETIAKAYQSKSTTELEQLLKDYDDSIYTTEAFEAMRRIITSRESEMRADIGKNIKFGENQEKIFQSKREEQRKNEYQKDLNRMLDESSTVLKSIKSLRAKRKIYFGVGTAIFLMALMISIFTRDWSTVKQWMIMIFVILGFPVGFNILKARKFAKKQIDLDDGVKNLSEKIRCSEEKSCGSLLSALQTEVTDSDIKLSERRISIKKTDEADIPQTMSKEFDGKKPDSGHVFMIPLGKGLWGACRVIREGDPKRRHPNDFMRITENGLLVMTTTWTGANPPDLSDPRLREPLITTFGEWKNEAEISWIINPLPDSFQYIGTIEPSPKELKIGSNERGNWSGLPNMIIRQSEWDMEEHPETIVEDGFSYDLNEYKEESLWYSAENGLTKVLKAAIKAGADPNAHNGTNTALMAAVRNRHTEAVKLLLEAGANPNIQNRAGDTALIWAGNHPETTSLLEGVTDPSKAISISQFPKMREQD